MSFDVAIVQEKVFGQVGWSQPLDPKYAILEPENLESRSGLRVNDNPYCTIRSLKETQNYQGISDVDFNLYLSQLQKTAITDVCNAVFNEYDYIDRQILYKNLIYKAESNDLPDGFVGYRIKVSSEKDQAFEITRVLLDFERPSGDEVVTLMLLSTEKIDPLFTIDVTVNSDRIEQVLNWKVNNSNGVYKGEYYLGYVTSSLTLKPYSRNLNNGNTRSFVTGLCIDPIKVLGHNTPTLFDIKNIESIEDYIGVNPDITVYDDYTDLILNNQTLFSRAIYLSACLKVMTVYLATLRSNKDQRKTSEIMVIIQQIEGQNNENHQKITGHRDMLAGQITTLRKEVKRLNDGYFTNGIYFETLT